MPSAPPRPCTYHGCKALVTSGSRCERHAPVAKRANDERRGSSTQRGYGYAWQKARAAFLREHPLCTSCDDKGYVQAAVVVDHIVPHKGDPQLFWNRRNWQPLCKPCHDAKTAREDGGFGRAPRGGGKS